MAGAKDSLYSRARRQIEQQLKQAEDDRRRNMMKLRLEYITNGVRASEQGKVGEATANFLGYIKLLEEWKGVAPGTLSPAYFDITKEMGDMLMLAGIYWDLSRFYDRTETPEKQQEFRHYLEKFITFSKGTSWEPLCAEQLRRYLLANRARHRPEFKNAYRLLGGEKCFVVTALSDETDPSTLPTLRRFRNEVLEESAWGRKLVAIYYRVGPSLARIVRSQPRFIRKGMAIAVDAVARKVQR